MIKFIITGLPRSGTTWLSVFLTTDDCVCLHDPYVTYTPEELEGWTGGISDTALWFYDDWCKRNTDKFILIEREPEEVAIALSQKGLPQVPEYLYNTYLGKSANKVVLFKELFEDKTLEDLWNYVHPEKEFNKIRLEQLKQIYMSPTIVERLYEESKASTTV